MNLIPGNWYVWRNCFNKLPGSTDIGVLFLLKFNKLTISEEHPHRLTYFIGITSTGKYLYDGFCDISEELISVDDPNLPFWFTNVYNNLPEEVRINLTF